MNYVLHPTAGAYLMSVLLSAKDIAADKECTVEFMMNGIRFLVDADTNVDHLQRDYHNAGLMGWKTVGPVCVEQYAPYVLAKLERRKKGYLGVALMDCQDVVKDLKAK